MKNIFPLLLLSALLAGCASPPKVYKVESVYVCAAEECGQAAQNYGAEQMLSGLRQLFQANDGQEIKYCESDPKTRTCKSESVCHFVQGGPLPGLGCLRTSALGTPQFDSAEKHILLPISPHYTFYGIGLACGKHDVTITARSVDEIVWNEGKFYCNWMGAGNMVHTFSIAIESIDFDRGIIGGYWAHANTGTGNGSGSGYGVLILPKAMPRGENWLTAQ